MPGTDFNFEGLSNEDNQAVVGGMVAPPDTAGAVGPNHYVQWVNIVFAIWELDRSGDVATLVYGPAAGNSLWQGFGGICESNNNGDIIVLYDELANRWFMSQFALFAPDGFHQCIAVSQTDDPTGAWHRYDFLVSETKLNDYPKFGVWPDGYYMAVNQFDGASFAWAGQGVWVFERDKILAGLPARQISFDLFDVDPNIGGMLPADLDGVSPSAGTPNYFLTFDDDLYGAPEDRLQLWAFSTDWVIPANSTFTLESLLPTAAFDSQICPAFRGQCIPQPDGAPVLEDLADRLMYRLQYRNMGDHAAMVVNHSVDVTGSAGDGRAGVRWYELRNAGAGWTIQQQGTFGPDDGLNRWMGSAAMDHSGNVAIGYSISSDSKYPSIRYTGRLADDPADTLPQGEVEMATGLTSQVGASRWGDYSMLTLDPLDDCTFWFTTEYVPSGNSQNWSNWFTRIGSFKFPTCTSGPIGVLQGVVTDIDTGDPIAHARVNLGGGILSFTDDSGFYKITLPVGSYDAALSAYGYLPDGATGLEILEDQTTVQDFALTAAPKVTVAGAVTDGGHGWPLYARIDIHAEGFDGTIFSDPQTGDYSVELFEGTEYALDVSAVSVGYLPESRIIVPPTGGANEDFTLYAAPECSAPGYLDTVNGCEAISGGLVVGNVYDENTGAGVNGAHIANDAAGATSSFATPEDPALDNGFYILFTPDGDHLLFVGKNGYGDDEALVSVVVNGVIRRDFHLRAGLLDATPPALSASLGLGDFTTVELKLANLGNRDAAFEFVELDGGRILVRPQPGAPVRVRHGQFSSGRFQPGVMLPDLQKPLPPPNAPPWTPVASYPSPIMDNTAAVWDGLVHSVGGYDGNIITANHYVYDPGGNAWSSLTPMTHAREKPAAAFIDGKLYVVGGWSEFGIPVADLEIYDPAADAWSMGAATPAAYAAGAGVALDDDFYVIGGCADACGTTEVYRYSPGADSWTQVAPYPEPISWAACGAIAGKIYCAGGTAGNSESDNTYVYDPTLDAWTQLADMPETRWGAAYSSAMGKLWLTGGVTDNFATVTNETLVYDPVADAWAPEANANIAVYRSGSACGFYKIGGSTGGFSPISDVELYPGLGDCATVGDVPWLSETPITGTVAAASAESIMVAFDAGAPEVDQPGNYFATLRVKNDTPYGSLSLPVTMTVAVPADWGKLVGVVTSPGYCDANPHSLNKAQVMIQGSLGFSRTLETDSAGAFAYWLDADESPLTVTVSKSGYEQQQATGVSVTAQTTTTQNFDLRILQPCLSVTPESMSVTIELEQTHIESLTLNNNGASAAEFIVSEADSGFVIALPTVQLPVYQPGVAAVATYVGDRAQAQPARSFTPPANALYSASSVNILLLAAADVTAIRSILDAFPDINQVDVYDARLSTPTLADLQPYDAVVVISNNTFADAVAVGDVLADYVDAGGKVVQTVATFYDPGGFGWGLQGRFVDEGYSPFIGIGDWFSWGNLGPFDASHPIMQGVTWASDYFRQVMELNSGAQWVASWNDDEFVATKGRVVGLNTFLSDGYAWQGDIPLIVHNSIIWLQTSGDVPWLSEEPTEGIVAPDSDLPVDVIFDARIPTITQPGAYFATLAVQSNDPERPRIGAPVTMTVDPPPTWGKLVGTVSSQGYCDASPTILSNAMVTIQGSQGGYWEVPADSSGNFAWWLDSAESPLTLIASAADHENQEINGVVVNAQETTTQDFSLIWLYPCLSMDPLSFEETLRVGDVIVRTLTLYNNGAGMGVYEIGELNHGSTIFGAQALAHAGGQVHVVDEDKGAHPEQTAGASQPGPSAAGGPDAFGYTFRDSLELDGPPYRWVEIAPQEGGDGIELASLTGVDDGYFYPLALPFTFPFYGTDYSQLAVASNGTLYFDDAYLGFGNSWIPSWTAYNVQRFMAPLWDDLVIDPGAIYYKDLGAMFIIEYYQVSGYGSPEPATWQAVLFPNGSILYQYQDVVFGDYRDFGGSATVGIQGDIDKGLQYSFDSPWLSNNLAICFAPPGIAPDCSTDVPWLDEIPPTGFIPPYSSAAVDVVFDATVPEVQEPATYLATLNMRTNDVFVSPLRAPVAMIVEPTVGPMLSVPPATGVVHFPVTVDVNFAGAEFQIAATAFSLDFDQDCLTFDPSDDDQDGIPDAIHFNTPQAFTVSAMYDGGDVDGEIDIVISDNLPPLSSLADGTLATVEFTPTCEPQPGETMIAPVGFSSEPKASFGNTSGQSVPGTVEHGWIEILSGIRGDCNNDGLVDAADIVACVLEIFDGDGPFWLDTPGGDFPGNPVGCDSNADRRVDAGDIVCTVLTIFEGPGACDLVVVAADAAPAKLILSDVAEASPGSTVQATLSLQSGGRGIAAAVLALDVDRAWLRINPTDADQDGVIDAVKFNAPEGIATSARINANTGALEIYLADLAAPLTTLTDGVLAVVTLEVIGEPGQADQPALFFAQGFDPSLGDVSGQSAPVETVVGQPAGDAAPDAGDLPIRTYLPTIVR
jgi:hypothetical protein